MRRILRVLTRPNVGGPTRQALALHAPLRVLGWQTLLVVGRCEGEAALDPADQGLERLSYAEVLRRGPEAEGYVEVAELRRSLHPLRDLRAAWALRGLTRAFRPDVVHTHQSKAGVLARRAAWRERVGTVAHTFHGHVLQDYFVRPFARWIRRIERQLAGRTTLLCAVSPSCRSELAALGVAAAERIHVVAPAIELAPFAAIPRAAARAALGIPEPALVLGFVGRLVPIKRPDLFAEVVRRIPQAVALVLGEGSERAVLTPLGPRLHALGAVPEPWRHLPACDVLVLASEREGCPLVAIEAFAAGVPVVGFDVPGIRDALDTWGAGLLVPRAAGVEGLVAAVRRLREEPALAAGLVARARRGLDRFAPAAVAQELARLYGLAEGVRPGAGRRARGSP